MARMMPLAVTFLTLPLTSFYEHREAAVAMQDGMNVSQLSGVSHKLTLQEALVDSAKGALAQQVLRAVPSAGDAQVRLGDDPVWQVVRQRLLRSSVCR